MCFHFIRKTVMNLETVSLIFSVGQQVVRSLLALPNSLSSALVIILFSNSNIHNFTWWGSIGSGSMVHSRAGCIMRMNWGEWFSKCIFLGMMVDPRGKVLIEVEKKKKTHCLLSFKVFVNHLSSHPVSKSPVWHTTWIIHASAYGTCD